MATREGYCVPVMVAQPVICLEQGGQGKEEIGVSQDRRLFCIAPCFLMRIAQLPLSQPLSRVVCNHNIYCTYKDRPYPRRRLLDAGPIGRP